MGHEEDGDEGDDEGEGKETMKMAVSGDYGDGGKVRLAQSDRSRSDASLHGKKQNLTKRSRSANPPPSLDTLSSPS